MRNNTLIKLLEEKGFIFSSCLQWTPADIDARMIAIGQNDSLKTMSQIDKKIIMEDFFAEYEDDICEFINLKLEDHLDSLTHYQPANEPI
jgi:hypothetical protein